MSAQIDRELLAVIRRPACCKSRRTAMLGAASPPLPPSIDADASGVPLIPAVWPCVLMMVLLAVSTRSSGRASAMELRGLWYDGDTGSSMADGDGSCRRDALAGREDKKGTGSGSDDEVTPGPIDAEVLSAASQSLVRSPSRTVDAGTETPQCARFALVVVDDASCIEPPLGAWGVCLLTW